MSGSAEVTPGPLAAAVERWCLDRRLGLGQLDADLAELERTDPAVAAAAASLDRVVDSILARRGVPAVRFRKSTGDRPCELIR